MSAGLDISIEGVKIAPPAAVTGALLMGMTPAEWITALTLLYLVMSIGLLIPKYWAQIMEWRRGWIEKRKMAKEEKKNGD